jgi:hypothetical protein
MNKIVQPDRPVASLLHKLFHREMEYDYEDEKVCGESFTHCPCYYFEMACCNCGACAPLKTEKAK